MNTELTPDELAGRLRSCVAKLTAELGDSFSEQQLLRYIQQHRGRPLQILYKPLPVAVTGLCISLLDADVILLDPNVDGSLAAATRTHEFAHPLLDLTVTLDTSCTFAEFCDYYEKFRPEIAHLGTARSMPISPAEQAVETLGRILLLCINDGNDPPANPLDEFFWRPR